MHLYAEVGELEARQAEPYPGQLCLGLTTLELGYSVDTPTS